jgi:dTDP-4-dehydrorhamnose reductase
MGMDTRAGSTPTLMVTGPSGQIGYELLSALAGLGRVVSVPRSALNLADSDAICTAIRTIRPTIVINAAAYTAVDRAESESQIAMVVNGTAPGVLAEEVSRVGGAIVHYSTDYVFDGMANRPLRETDPIGPVNEYGLTKLAGERAIAASGAPHLVFRTSWIYSERGQNFVRTILRLAGERDELRVVDDQHGTPTSAGMVARVTAIVLGVIFDEGGIGALKERGGTYHLTAAGETTWYDFARAILGLAPPSAEGRAPKVVPIPSEQYPTPAARPHYSVLDCGKLDRAFGVTREPWQAALGPIVARLSPRMAAT